MYERFTDRARKVMQLANVEAQRFNHEYIGTEHILLGLVQEGSGIAATALTDLGIDLGKILVEVETIVQCGPDMVSMGNLPQTPRAKKVIEFAIEEARKLNHKHVGTEHLLIGLIREEGGVAGQVLKYMGLSLPKIRDEVCRLRQLDPWAQSALSPARVYERFTDRSRKVMQLASKEAERFNHEYIGTEHLLLGLVTEGAGVAAVALQNLGIDLDKIRAEVEKIVPSGPDMVTPGGRPQTPRMKKVIEYSIEEAGKLDHNYVGTEHLLLGLIREEEGVAAQVLMNLGLNLAAVRAEVLTILGHPVDAPPPAAKPPEVEPTPPDLPAIVTQAASTAQPNLPNLTHARLGEIDAHFDELMDIANQMKEEAVAAQDFERAVVLRDQVERLGKMREWFICDHKRPGAPGLEPS